MIEMDSPPREGLQSSRNFNPLLQNSSNFFSNQHRRNDEQTVYFEDLDVFDEFEKHFKDFLKSTPYIE